MLVVAVVGAGAVGAAVAARLGTAGARVTLVDGRAPGTGTSAATLAWVNAVEHGSREYFELRVAALREHADLERELGGDWLRRSGALEWAADEAGFDALGARVDLLCAWGYPAERVAVGDVTALERGLALDPAAVPWVAHYPGDAWAQPERLVGALVEAATARGVTLEVGRRVTAVDVAGGRVRGVVLDGGGLLRADVVVNCAGADAPAVAEMMGLRLPLERRPGLVVATTSTAALLRRVVRAPGLGLRPEAGGRVLVSAVFADVAEGDPSPGARSAVAHEALARARELLPALADAGVGAARVGVRPVPTDGMPVVGPVPGVEGAYIAVTHSGITLAPLLGRLVAEEVVHGRADDRLAPFRPDRLAEPPR